MPPPLLRAGPVVIAAAAVIVATTFPVDDPEVRALTACVICGERGLADALLNVLLFLPLGAALVFWLGRRAGALLLAAGFSGVIETLQLLVIPGRDPNVGDVLFNTIGAALGVALVAGAVWWAMPTAARGRALAWSWSAAIAAAILGTGWLLAPALPRSAYFGGWTPDLGHLAWYRGRVLDAHLDSVPVPSWRLADSDQARTLLLAGEPITVRLVAGPAPHALAPIVIINDGEQREIVLIGQDREDLVFRHRTRARAFRLDQPDFRVEGGMRDTRSGDTVQIASRLGEHGPCLQLNGTMWCGIGITPAGGWSLLMYPEHLPRWAARAVGVVWLMLLFAPLGFWIGRDGGNALAALPAGLALIIAPLVTPLQFSSPGELALMLAAILVGSFARRVVDRGARRA